MLHLHQYLAGQRIHYAQRSDMPAVLGGRRDDQSLLLVLSCWKLEDLVQEGWFTCWQEFRRVHTPTDKQKTANGVQQD